MTEQEAIENIENYIKKCNYTWRVERIFDEYLKYLKGEYISYTANDVIQNCHRSLEKLFTATAINALKEIQRYRKIGTAEECREAREKQKAMKPKEILRHRGGFEIQHCPNCNMDYQVDRRYEITDGYCPVCGKLLDSVFKNYCANCGQAIENENLEEMENE